MTEPQSAPSISVAAVLLNGLATAVFPSRPYPRVVVLVDMQNPVAAGATIYRGTVNGAFTRITSNPQGSNQQWTNPFKLPAGQGVFVQWTASPPTVGDARATITWMEQNILTNIRDRRLYGESRRYRRR
jgi:hypothetical protein